MGRGKQKRNSSSSNSNKSPKRNKRGKKKLGAKRLAAIDRIERAKKRKGQPVTASPATGVAPKTPAKPRPVVRTDPAAAEKIAEARALGLSVADDTSAKRVAELLERFDLALAYVGDVWDSLADGAAAPDDELRRFTSRLFSDGRVAEGVVTSQRQRQANPARPVTKDPHYREVAKALRGRLGHALPPRSLWSRLLRR